MTKQEKPRNKQNKGTKTTYSTLSSKNQITVPSLIREKMNAEPGDQLIFQYNEETEEVTINTIKKDTLLSLYGSMPPRGELDQEDWNDIRREARKEMFEQKSNNK